jgi:16S rRNA U1498 N3-methylase RsmE
MPANDRLIGWLKSRSCSCIQPLMIDLFCRKPARAERAGDKSWARIGGVAVAACEQADAKPRAPVIHDLMTLADWPAAVRKQHHSDVAVTGRRKFVFRCRRPSASSGHYILWNRCGLGLQEEAAACAAGFKPVTLGQYALRPETAPLSPYFWVDAGRSTEGLGTLITRSAVMPIFFPKRLSGGNRS